MIMYLRDGAALYALAVTRQSARIVRLGRYARIEEALLRVRADLDAEAGRALPPRLAATVAAATARDSAQLAAMLLAPVADLARDRELIIVPTGLLVTVPWAMLAGNGRPVTVAPSATFWLDTRHRRDTVGRGDSATVALAAGPGTQRGETEIAEIARLHPGAAALPAGAATPAATLAAMDGTSVVHLAAHGTHQPDNALFSALELSGGPLMGYDLQRLKAAPALVVLSCCDLGLADVRPGDETLGMVSALLHTGTRTVVASVTQVADDTAMRVMTGLHAALRQSLPPPQALAQATRHEPCGFVCFGAG
jgi:CHAT domain-containing protein